MNKQISIAKAIAIILMVVAHSACPELLNKYIYAFHMPLFFMVSGYLFKDKYLSDPINFIKKKFKGLYVPFVKWSLIFLVFHNVLFSLGCYNTSYTIKEMGANAIKYITMMGSEQLLGGYWFLKELLIASIISFFIIKVVRRIHTYILVAILLLDVAYLLSIASFKIPFISSRTFLACLMFIGGYNLKISVSDTLLRKWYAPIVGYTICLIAVLTIPNLGGVDVSGWRIFPYTLAAVSGSLAVYSTSGYIERHLPRLSDLLVYVGKQTLYILTFHFLSFKLISWFLISGLGKEGHIYDFPIIYDLGGAWWILYIIVGVSVPMILWSIKNKLTSIGWLKLIKKK